MSVSDQDLIQLLEVLFQGRRAFSRTSFFTIEEIQELSDSLNLPLPADIEATLRTGIRRGVYLRCAVEGTQFTGSPQYQYAYNPDMLRVNNANARLMNQRCLSAFASTGTTVVSANNRCPCYNTRGEITGLYGLPSTNCDPTNPSLNAPINPAVIRSISRCCSN